MLCHKIDNSCLMKIFTVLKSTSIASLSSSSFLFTRLHSHSTLDRNNPPGLLISPIPIQTYKTIHHRNKHYFTPPAKYNQDLTYTNSRYWSRNRADRLNSTPGDHNATSNHASSYYLIFTTTHIAGGAESEGKVFARNRNI